MAYFECSSCGQVSLTNLADCPTCGGLETFLEQSGELEVGRISTETGEDGAIRERTPEEVRQEVSGELSALGGTPQRPVP